MIYIFVTVSASLIISFYSGVYPPISVSLMAFMACAFYLMFLYSQRKVGPLTVVLFSIYSLPFVHLVPYLWFDFESANVSHLWGLAVNPYMLDEKVIRLVAILAAVGGVAFVMGSLFNGRDRIRQFEPKTVRTDSYSTLPLSVFGGWVAGATMFIWIAAPRETLLRAAYAQSSTIAERVNLGSAWLISFVLFTFAFADSLFEASEVVGRWKRGLLVSTIGFAVVYFQVLRGDRESFPFLITVFIMCTIWGKNLPGAAFVRKKGWKLKAVVGCACVFVGSFIVGAVRHALVGVSDIPSFLSVIKDVRVSGAMSLDMAISGTWSAVLLTPLSVAGDHIYGLLALKSGETYWQYIQSIVPGFVADAIGYTRPIDATRGPAWEMRYGAGGTHALVVPFINFRIVGILVIIALWNSILSFIEKRVVERLTVVRFAFLGVVCMSGPHWLWYSDKVIINAVILWGVIAVVYKVITFVTAPPQVCHSVRDPALRGRISRAPKRQRNVSETTAHSTV